MAACDYRSCDVCGGKAFYDAELAYESMSDENSIRRGATPMRYAGREQFSEPELTAKFGQVLGYVGDWAVLCTACSKTHRTAILPRESATGTQADSGVAGS
ncbi:MAG TPA: hypothetical protein VF453_06400 [Burkholderiaceae bacterium]